MTDVLFLSAVSDEFGDLRRRLARFLERTKRIIVRHQDDFVETGQLTLPKLRSEIEKSSAVIHVIGGMTGSVPPVEQVEQLLSDLKAVDGNPGFEDRFPEVAELARSQKLTYTQWEAWLALFLDKRLLRFHVQNRIPNFSNDTVALSPSQQEQVDHLKRLPDRMVYPKSVPDDESLFHEILHSLLELEMLSASETEFKPNNLPFSTLGPSFKGRDEFLDEISHGLKQGVTAIAANNFGSPSLPASETKLNQSVTDQKPTAVSGSGGIGKTRAAIEYAWRHEGEYNALLFIEAPSPDSLLANLAKLWTVLKIHGLEESSDEIRRNAVLEWLDQHPGWLAIIDNVDTPDAAEEVKRQLPALTRGHVLITSRLARWSGVVKKLELGILSLPASIDYLMDAATDRTPFSDDRQQAELVAKKTGRLALGLEHAKAYINLFGISFAEYLQRWEQDEARILQEFEELKSEIDYPRELLVTWKLSVDRLDSDARKLLEVLAWFAADPIPESVLANLPDGYLSTDAHTALARLVAICLVTRDRENETPSFKLHRLVQATTRFHLRAVETDDSEIALPSLESALETIDRSFVGDPTDVRTWPVLEPLVEHAQAICEVAIVSQKTTVEHATARLLNQIGLLLAVKVRFREAESNYRRALKIDETSYGKQHPNVAIRLNDLAQLLQTTNRLAQAEPLMRRALQIDETSYGRDHPNVAIRLNNLATLLHDTNRLAEAEPLMRRTLQIDEASYGEQHPSVAIALHNLAILLKATNRLAEAEPLMRRALQINENFYGKQHPNVANDLSNLAQLFATTNRLAEAEPLMRRALQINENSYGKQHPKVANNLSNLATLLKATNRLAEAEPLIRSALRINESSYGEEHPNVAIDLNNLVILLQAANRLDEAEPLMRRALQINENSYGKQHPNVAINLNNLATLLKATNRLEEAEFLMRRALQIDENSHGKEHPEVAIDLNNLAVLLQATSRLDEAEPLMRRALHIDENSYGEEHPEVAIRLNNLAQLLQANNRLAEAEPLMRRALKIDENSYGKTHPDVAIDLNNLARLLQATNRSADAEPLMRRALKILVTSLGADHPNSQTVEENLKVLMNELEKS